MFDKTLVAVDESQQASWALQAAIELAQRLAAQLALVHVGPEHQASATDQEQERKSEKLLRRLKSIVPESINTVAVSRTGNPVTEIISAAQDLDTDLIFMGTHGRGRIQQLFLGSTTEGVARWAPCPLITVRRAMNGTSSQPQRPSDPELDKGGLPKKEFFRRIMIAVDASEPALAALASGLEIAHRTGAEVAVVHVANTVYPWLPELGDTGLAPRSEIRRRGQILLDRILADLPTTENCETILRDGEPAKEILAAANEWKADLIVLGTQGFSHFEQFVLGSVANAIMRGARCPVMAVRTDALNVKRPAPVSHQANTPAPATARCSSGRN